MLDAMPSGAEERNYRLAFAALMATVAGVFWPYVLTSGVPFYRDISAVYYPHAVELRTLVRAGQLPLWNPFEHFGEPTAVNLDYLLFYPTSWLAWILPVGYGLKLHYVLHFFFAGAGSFLLAKRIGLKPWSSYLAGALFVFGGPVMSLGNFLNHLPSGAWIAWVILAADFGVKRGGWRGITALALAFTLQLFAAGPETSLATFVLALAWVLVFCGANRTVLRRFLSAMALAAGLWAVQAFPALWHLRHTDRAARLGYEAAFFWSFQPLRIFEVLFPYFWGNPLSLEKVPWAYLEGREPFLISVFIGILPIGLVLILLATTGARRSRTVQFWCVAAIAAFIIALGRYTPASYFFYYVVPVFRIIRYPMKFLVPLSLAIAQLAAMGAESVWDAAPTGKRVHWLRTWFGGFAALWLTLSIFVLLPVGRALALNLSAAFFTPARVLALQDWLPMTREQVISTAAIWLRSEIAGALPYALGATLFLLACLHEKLNPRLRHAVVGAICAAAVIPLLSAHYTLNPLTNARFYSSRPPAMDYLHPAHPPLRIFAEPLIPMPDLEPAPLRVHLPDVSFLLPTAYESYVERLSLQDGAGSEGIETGYAPDITRMLPSEQHALNVLVAEYKVRYAPLARLLRVSGMEYALYRRMPPAEGLEWLGTAPNASNAPVQVFRVLGAAPRAYLVGRATFLPAGIGTIHRLVAADFDPAQEVVLEESQRNSALPAGSGGEAKLLGRDANIVEAETISPTAAYLVLTDSYDPQWQVTIDGQPAQLLRANQIFRAVTVPAGSHRVAFRYRPWPLFIGAGVTALCAVCMICGCILDRRDRQ